MYSNNKSCPSLWGELLDYYVDFDETLHDVLYGPTLPVFFFVLVLFLFFFFFFCFFWFPLPTYCGFNKHLSAFLGLRWSSGKGFLILHTSTRLPQKTKINKKQK